MDQYEKSCKYDSCEIIISTTCNSRSIIFYPPTYIIIYYDLELLDLHIPFSIHIHLLIRSDIGIPFVYHHHQIHSVRPKWINTETEILVKFTEPKTKIQK